MCAINGFTWGDEALIKRMDEKTRHRGPDGTAVFVDAHISLGHNRLKIIDLSENAKQPMESTDGNLVIVFNGEIYNYLDIKRELSDYAFRSQSDTEVILAAYQKWGSACVERFNGIFAFAIWNKRTRELFLARDPLGVKPLYYFWDGTRFMFSSEIKAILEHDVPRIVDTDAFNQYLRLEYVPEPLTMFKHIKKFPAASRGLLAADDFTIERYWNIAPSSGNDSFDESVARVRTGVEAAVRRQLVSDRPVGVYLSGGIDSSVVLCAATKTHPHIDTFSVGFALTEAEESSKFNADFDLARRTAAFFGANHHEILMSSEEIVPLFEQAVRLLDEPISNPTVIPMLKLSALAKEHITVALGGDGGDELFGGYDRYRLSRAATLYQRWVPSSVCSLLAHVHDRFKKLAVPPGVDRYMLFMAQPEETIREVVQDPYFDATVTRRLLHDAYFSESILPSRFDSHFMDVDRRTWLVDEALMRTDKMGMANGLELRVPLLDKELVETATHIPIEHKVTPWATKRVLKEAFRSELPAYLFDQPKRGWIAPGAKWLRHPHVERFARTVLSADYHPGTCNLIRWDAVTRMLDDHVTMKRYNLTVLWALLTFQVWAKEHNVTLS